MKIVITAGPTREPIDPVRFISNRSSGKMGYAVAEAAANAGHDVTLISGPVCLSAPANVSVVQVVSSDDMADAFAEHVVYADLAVMSAAVADFKPAHPAAHKIKKGNAPQQLALVRTRDFFPTRESNAQKNLIVVGFAAETNNVEEYARKKLHEKNCDLIVANDVSRMDAGFESDYNIVTLYFRDGNVVEISRETKQMIAQKLVNYFQHLAEKR